METMPHFGSLFFISLFGVAIVQSVINTEFGPHQPSSDLWFEGWYTRLQSPNLTLAIVLAHFPNQTTEATNNTCFLLFQPETGSRRLTQHFQAFELYDRSNASGLDFDFLGKSDGYGCTYSLTERSFSVKWWSSDIDIELTSIVNHTAATIWSEGSVSPEGWVASLAPILNLRYNVFSLRTPASYSVTQKHNGVSSSGLGYIHMEKNWGRAFPSRWIWMEGQSTDGPEVAFVLAGGPYNLFGPWLPAIPMYVMSLHSPTLNFTVDPYNPMLWYRLNLSACESRIELVMYTLTHKITVVVVTDPDSFMDIPCPTEKGFVDFAEESFVSKLDLTIRPRFLRWSKVPEAFHITLTNVALEFGGEYTCKEEAHEQSRAQKNHEEL